jgi:predicted RecA/RadA family phage recombinase
MAALTDNKEVQEKEGKLIDMPVVASDIIYKGAIVKINAAGYAAPMAAEASAYLAGIAYEKADNSSGSAGDINCRVITEGSFLLEGSGFSQASVGDNVYASDDQTISDTQGTNEIKVGKIVEYVSATQVWVKINASVA